MTTSGVGGRGFGRQRLAEWMLDPAVTYLNHGTVGAPPRAVLEAQRRIQDEIERQPASFLLRELSGHRVGRRFTRPPRMREAAERVASFLGARGADLFFVDNATTGANAVLRSFRFDPGDELMVTSLGYGAVSNAARFVAREAGIALRTLELPVMPSSPNQLVAAIDAGLSPRTRLAIVDHIASDSALLLPIEEIAKRCREKKVRLLVDGAHAPGAIPLEIPAIGADWYVGNLHKWAWAPRSSAVLWVDPARREALHPTVISWGLDHGLDEEFDLVGTRDPSPFLTAPFALDLLATNGLERIQRYNHDLVWEGAKLLAERWGSGWLPPEEMVATMVSLPAPARCGSTAEDAARLRDALLFEDGIEVHVSCRAERVWVRVAAQIYNEIGDFERLADAVVRHGASVVRH